jgi:D-threo-aldose 1-dehydrogenase
MPAAALQFPLAHPSVASVIPGGFQPAHIEANLAYLESTIPTAFWSELKHEALIRAEAPVPGGGN